MAQTPTEPTAVTETYALLFYDRLVELSEVEEIDGKPVTVFRGKVSDVFSELGLSQVYYSRIRRIFLKYDCVTYAQRGTRAYDSVLVLHQPPPQNLPEEDLTDRPGDGTLTALNERVEILERTVQVLESRLGGINIVEALRNFEHRLQIQERGNGSGKTKT